MLTELAYQSIDEFESDYVEHLVREASELSMEHAWWHQPFAIAPLSGNPYRLGGSTKLMRRYIQPPVGGSPRKIDYRDDVLLGAVDTLALLEMLTILSREHAFDWNVLLPASPKPKQVGRVRENEVDPKLFELIMPELDALNISEKELENESLHAELRAKYFPSS